MSKDDFTDIKALFQIAEPCGYDAVQLQPWRDKFGEIPRVLLEYYTQLGAHQGLNGSQDFLVKPEEIADYLQEDCLIFYTENQEVSIWGIRKEDLSRDDPPVYESYDEGETWLKTTDTLTEFLRSMCYLQGAFGLEFGSEGFWDIDEGHLAAIRQRYSSKNADSGLYTGVRFFGDRDDSVIAVMNNRDGYIMFFASRDEDYFEEMFDELEELVTVK